MNDPKGYYSKFKVIRRDTGEEVTERTFTLLMDSDRLYAAAAIRGYVDELSFDNPDHPLIADLESYLAETD